VATATETDHGVGAEELARYTKDHKPPDGAIRACCCGTFEGNTARLWGRRSRLFPWTCEFLVRCGWLLFASLVLTLPSFLPSYRFPSCPGVVGPDWPCNVITYACVLGPSIPFILWVAPDLGSWLVVVDIVLVLFVLLMLTLTAYSDPGYAVKMSREAAEARRLELVEEGTIDDYTLCGENREGRYFLCFTSLPFLQVLCPAHCHLQPYCLLLLNVLF
jgi:hypothetical protein